jgi:hypothetical protein
MGDIDQVKLGYLKLEGKSADLSIFAKKSYVFGEKRVSKGIKKNAVQQEDGAWRQVHFTSLKWAFKQGNLDDVFIYEVDKHVQNTLTHGKIGKGGQVHPPQFAMKQEDVAKLIEPRDSYSWNWWVDVPWLQTVWKRKRVDYRSLFPCLFEPSREVEPLYF